MTKTNDFDLMGTCGYCGRRYTANTGNRVAKHGYEIPQGWRQHVGQCPGSGMLAFEVSTAAAELLLQHLRGIVERTPRAAENIVETALRPEVERQHKLHTYLGEVPEITIGVADVERDPKRKSVLRNGTTSYHWPGREAGKAAMAVNNVLDQGYYAEREIPVVREKIAKHEVKPLTKRPKPPETDYCPGSGKSPVNDKFAHHPYATCSGCGSRQRKTQNYVIRKHKAPTK